MSFCLLFSCEVECLQCVFSLFSSLLMFPYCSERRLDERFVWLRIMDDTLGSILVQGRLLPDPILLVGLTGGVGTENI